MGNDMDAVFNKVYNGLNNEQRSAVDAIDGPLLVVAGPGTGKTQLLSARVAHILRSTDTLPQNILCLTFTESGAANMRQRLASFIGKSAYDVTIGTYHAFGGEIINRYGEFIDKADIGEPLDPLRQHQIVSKIVDDLDYHDRLKQTRHHLGDLISTISEMKRALISPDDMRQMATENAVFIDSFNSDLHEIFAGLKRMPGKLNLVRPYFEQTLSSLHNHAPNSPVNETYGSLANSLIISLDAALAEADASEKSTPLTKWKNKWLVKDGQDNFILNSHLENERLLSLASVMETYNQRLLEAGYYDFDDMILRAIDALKNNDDLRYTMQEKYQYILLDEFQDTNNAQAELIYLLTDNPVNEGRPNVMAVGDDDQAIYAFQGAQFSNMMEFFTRFRGTALVNLKNNYRSHADILEAAGNVARQINERLSDQFSSESGSVLEKRLTAAGGHDYSHIERRDFKSALGEYAWVARKVAGLIEDGVKPEEIAILTPKHSALEAVVPYLSDLKVPMRYDKRENILEDGPVVELLDMARLVLAIGHDENAADALWPAVLSFEGFKIPVSKIWEISWKVNDDRNLNWTRALLESDDVKLKQIAWLMTAIAQKATSEPAENILDYLTGETEVTINEPECDKLKSSFKDYYLEAGDTILYDTLSALTVLRTVLREYQKTAEQNLKIQDLIDLVDAYNLAEQRMLNTSPYNEAESAVQLMTVFKSKGLEFEHVFLMNMTDELWGAGGGGSNKLTLPANLAPTRHGSSTEDETLRLLFVALTRAKHSLYLTSYSSSFSGKATRRLRYLDEREDENKIMRAHVLPHDKSAIIEDELTDDAQPPSVELLEKQWTRRHLQNSDVTLKSLLSQRLEKYQMSPTHLNSFYDLIYGGPKNFFLKTILRFPSAPGLDGQFGTAIHDTLEWMQHQATRGAAEPTIEEIYKTFESELKRQKIPESEFAKLVTRGQRALAGFIRNRPGFFKKGDRAETNFKNEGVFIEGAHMAGKIDRLEIDEKNKTIVVVDYKTGSPHSAWKKSDTKLYKYRQQLICYKLLIENSHTYKGYTVTGGRLEFIEPDKETGATLPALNLDFDNEEVVKTRQLINATWQAVKALDFPDISEFKADINGIHDFEMLMLDKYPPSS